MSSPRTNARPTPRARRSATGRRAPVPIARGAAGLPRTLGALLALALLAATPAFAAAAGTRPAATGGAPFGVPLHASELARVAGGTCTTCGGDGSGGGGGGTGSSGAPVKVGDPYWSTYRSATLSTSSSPATWERINNWSPTSSLDASFTVTFRKVRDVQFSGGYANYVKVSIGGEIDRTTSTQIGVVVPPMSYAKRYTRYVTERRQLYGRKYQDYSDGTRLVIDSSSGPYETVNTLTGVTTGSLP